ncbi:hypothetical protein Q5Y75_06930 [Ruegeria sp. 2205SS24-7]|uniref:hypothetical protein n=1 Tax=Ruegeria discodermiae TaxID=3064389 RepID=UPI002741D8B1|nr:hypothetical protein [Ruegeria sp. 2205SS24-7]MDP5216946.1 hypothetical protein [Ruegeria sp. 2205SS24-7]
MSHDAHLVGVASASGGRIWNEKKYRVQVYPAIRGLISLGGTQPGWRGFSSYGHRLGSLYRKPSKPRLTLMAGYERKRALHLLLVSNTEIPTSATFAKGGMGT